MEVRHRVQIVVVVVDRQGLPWDLSEHPDSQRAVWEGEWKEGRLSLPLRQIVVANRSSQASLDVYKFPWK
jgi:hypothetical protein